MKSLAPTQHVLPASTTHQPLPSALMPRGLGGVLGLVTAVDFCSTLSVLLAAAEIQHGLAASASEFLWLLVAYAGAGVVTLPLIERAGRRWHYRDLMVTGLVLYLLGALLAAASSSFMQILPARILQGIGGGGLFTMARVYLQLVLPQAERPRQLKGFMVGLLGGVAPLSWLTAALVQSWGWRASFVLQAAFAGVMVVIVLRRLRAELHTPGSLGSLDWVMILSFMLGMLLLLHGLESLELQQLTLSQLSMIGLASGCLGFAIWRSHRHPDPLLRLSVLNGRRYLVGLAFYGLYYLVNGAMIYLYPRLFHDALGLGLGPTGALQSFAGLVTVVTLLVYFRTPFGRGDRRRLIAIGFAGAALGFLLLSLSLVFSSSWLILILPLVLKGVFPVLGVVQIAGLTYTEIPHEDFAHAYALKNIVRLLTNTFAAGLVSQYFLRTSHHCNETLAYCQSIFGLPTAARPWGATAEQIERQIAVLVGQDVLIVLSGICLSGAFLVLWQKRMK